MSDSYRKPGKRVRGRDRQKQLDAKRAHKNDKRAWRREMRRSGGKPAEVLARDRRPQEPE